MKGYKTIVAGALLVLSVAMSSQGALYARPDYTLDTPVGRIGYAELHTTVLPADLGAYLYLGPLGECHLYKVVLLCCSVSAFAWAIHYWVCVRSRRSDNDELAEPSTGGNAR